MDYQGQNREQRNDEFFGQYQTPDLGMPPAPLPMPEERAPGEGLPIEAVTGEAMMSDAPIRDEKTADMMQSIGEAGRNALLTNVFEQQEVQSAPEIVDYPGSGPMVVEKAMAPEQEENAILAAGIDESALNTEGGLDKKGVAEVAKMIDSLEKIGPAAFADAAYEMMSVNLKQSYGREVGKAS